MYRPINEVTKSICASNSAKPIVETGHVTWRSFPGSSMVKNLPANDGDSSSIPG